MRSTHYGDEDSKCEEPEPEELFETARCLGWKPEDMKDREFAAKYREWLKTAPPNSSGGSRRC